jgi:hypothetical protein
MADSFPEKKGSMMLAPTPLDLGKSFLNIIPDIYK